MAVSTKLGYISEDLFSENQAFATKLYSSIQRSKDLLVRIFQRPIYKNLHLFENSSTLNEESIFFCESYFSSTKHVLDEKKPAAADQPFLVTASHAQIATGQKHQTESTSKENEKMRSHLTKSCFDKQHNKSLSREFKRQDG